MVLIRFFKIIGYDVKYLCFICYFLWGMIIYGLNFRLNDIKIIVLLFSKIFNLFVSVIIVLGVC